MHTEKPTRTTGTNSTTKLIEDIKEAEKLQKTIQITQDKIRKLEEKTEKKIQDLVYKCSNPKELGELCESFGIEKQGAGWYAAYENSMSDDPDYNKTEWCDIQFHVALDLQEHIREQAKVKK